MTAGVSTALTKGFYKTSVESLYAEWNGEKFKRVFGAENLLPIQAANAYEDFRAHISNDAFPCIGARAAINGGSFRVGFYERMNAPETNALLAHDLRAFAAEQRFSTSNYASFAAIFAEPNVENEVVWEKTLWTQLENLHELDADSPWDSTVSSNPENANFSFSFAETGFFIVGLHAQSSRLSRRFSRAAMVFNPHAQFERLRESNQFERMQATIRARDVKLQGSLNPNLSDFGKQSEAKQYSGRAVEADWKCPFHALIKDSKKFGE